MNTITNYIAGSSGYWMPRENNKSLYGELEWSGSLNFYIFKEDVTMNEMENRKDKQATKKENKVLKWIEEHKEIILGGFTFMLGCAVTAVVTDRKNQAEKMKSYFEGYDAGYDDSAKCSTDGFDWKRTTGITTHKYSDYDEFHESKPEAAEELLEFAGKYGRTKDDITGVHDVTFVEFNK